MWAIKKSIGPKSIWFAGLENNNYNNDSYLTISD